MSTAQAFQSAFNDGALRTWRIVTDPWFGVISLRIYSAKRPGWVEWERGKLDELKAALQRQQLKVTNRASALVQGSRRSKGGAVNATKVADKTDQVIDSLDLRGLNAEIPDAEVKDGVAEWLFEFVDAGDWENTKEGRLAFLTDPIPAPADDPGRVVIVPAEGRCCSSCEYREPWETEAWAKCPACGVEQRSDRYRYPFGHESVGDAFAKWIRAEAEAHDEYLSGALEEAASALGEPQTGSTDGGQGSGTMNESQSSEPANSTSVPTNGVQTAP